MAKGKGKTDKTADKASETEKKVGDEPVVKVTTVKADKAPKASKNIETERVSGNHRVRFMPNGTNPKLGLEELRPAATTAQNMVDQGFGHIIKD